MRRTLRTRLMLLYALPFALTVAVLLSALLLQTRESVPANGLNPIPNTEPGQTRQLVAFSAVALCVTVLISVGLGWIIAGRYLRPLRTITATARDISASNLHRRLGPTGHGDEFTELAATLDDLFGRLEASFESQRHFVANAAHELRTPLTAERALLQVALADPDASLESMRTAAHEALALGRSSERLIDALLMLASGEQGVESRTPFDLALVAAAVVRARTDEAARRGLRLSLAAAPAPAAGDASLVESLVANLVDNALRHNTPSDGWLAIETSTVDGRARLTVSNSGPVIPASEVGRLRQPFQRLGRQRVGEGHGLGLAIVTAIAAAHHATLSLHPRDPGGLTITVTFPTP
jgi:signal transduction histidine kinase